MAIIHQASLTPSKLEILSDYLPTIPALAEHVDEDFAHIGAYRFDDPDGHVGIETHILFGAKGAALQMPLTYRNEQLEGAEDWLLGTMQHSVLGERWVYNGCGDAVYVSELLRVILTGDTEVAEIVETQDGPVPRESSVKVVGSGSTEPMPDAFTFDSEIEGDETHIHVRAGAVVHRIVVRHVMYRMDFEVQTPRLTGTWRRSTAPTLLAYLQ